MKIKYVFFDCWDTLIQFTRQDAKDDARVIYEYITNKDKMSFDEFGDKFKSIITEYYLTTKFEVNFSQIINYLLVDNELTSDLSVEELAEKVALSWKPKEVEGVRDFLKYLDSQNIRYSVVSNTIQTHAQTERYLRNVFKDDFNFERIFASSDYAVKKPNPRFYLLAAHVLHLDPKEILFIGDRYDADCVGPSKANMNPCLINWKKRQFEHKEEVEHLEFTSYKDIEEYLRKENN